MWWGKMRRCKDWRALLGLLDDRIRFDFGRVAALPPLEVARVLVALPDLLHVAAELLQVFRAPRRLHDVRAHVLDLPLPHRLAVIPLRYTVAEQRQHLRRD